MKKHFLRTLALLLVLCTVLSVTAMAASNISLTVSIEDDEGDPYVYKFSRTTRYLTEDTNLLAEVVKIIYSMYDPEDPETDLWKFDTIAMKKIMDGLLDAYAHDNHQKWHDDVENFFYDVNPVVGDRSLKSLLKDKDSMLGDLRPNMEHKISFKNEVEGDRKYGVTYYVTVTRNGGSYYGDGQPGGTYPGGRPGTMEGVVAGGYPGTYPDGYPGGKGKGVFLNLDDHYAYIKGYSDDTVRPNAYITREEVTTIFYRLLTQESRAAYQTKDCDFTDVAANRWSREAIATMANAGIVKGYPDDSFKPQNNMTRAEFAAVAARFDKTLTDGADQFSDIAGHWAADEINSAAEKGWVKGFEGKFRPDDYITRAEAVTLINRVLCRQVESVEDLLPNMNVFTDNMDTSTWYYLDIQEAANGHFYVRRAHSSTEIWTDMFLHNIAG